MGIFVKFWLFMMPAHQIWSCHVTQDANFQNFLFCLNSTFNIRKNHKISIGKVLYSPPPPVPLGLRNLQKQIVAALADFLSV